MSMFDNLAKGAMESMKKAEKVGEAAETAKGLLHGVKEAAAGKVPEEVLEALRKLVAEAKRLLAESGNPSKELEAAVDKAEKLLNSKELSLDVVTKVTAELTALINAGKKQPAAAQKAAPAASKAAPKAAPAAPKAAPAAAKKPEAAPAKKVQFSDVKEGVYYYDAVQWAVQKGIVNGTSSTTFSPDQNCTRSQTVTIIWRAEGSPAPKAGKSPFTDVPENAFYAEAAKWAAERGIVSGTKFDPDGEITRAQLATMLYRNAGSPAVSGAAPFKDVPADSWYAKAVAWVNQKGIASGTGEGTFSPDGVCTRGQIVTFLYRAKK